TDTSTPKIHTLSLHDALPILNRDTRKHERVEAEPGVRERRGERVPIHVSIQVRGLREDNSKVDEAAEAVVVITSVKIVRWILFSLSFSIHERAWPGRGGLGQSSLPPRHE